MRRNFKIFLSYAREDFQEVSAAHEALVSEGFEPWLDRVRLRPGQEWRSAIKRAIKEADLVIIFLSSRSIKKRGYVQAEIKIALEVLQEIPPGRIFVIPARLEDCKIPNTLSDIQCCEIFNDGISALITAVKATYAEHIGDDTELVKGWMKGHEKDHNILKDRLHDSPNPVLQRILRRLDMEGPLSRRLSHNSGLKAKLAMEFYRRYFKVIVSGGINSVFVDSGSSMAFLGKQLAGEVSDKKKDYGQSFSFATNNAVTFMDFALCGLNVALIPAGNIDSFYGAAFGTAADLPPDPVRHHGETVKEKQVIEKLAEEISVALGKNGLICTTASALSPHPLGIIEMTVGSYQNMLMKRALLRSGYPVVCLVDGTKWMNSANRNQYQIFSGDFPFRRFLAERQFFLISAFDDTRTGEQFSRYFQQMESGIVTASSIEDGITTVTYTSARFAERFPERSRGSAAGP